MCLCFSWFSNTFCSCKYFFITSECPTGFKNIPGLTTCYAVILSSKTWYQARDNCASRHNSKLVSIENEEERLRLGEHILGKISVSLYIHTCRFYILTNKSQNLYSLNRSFAMTHLFVIDEGHKGYRGSITSGWKEEVFCTSGWFCVSHSRLSEASGLARNLHVGGSLFVKLIWLSA